MKQIGFTNYKRFKNLAPLDLGRVTLIVGANNSGKSTFLKGLLLANENTINLNLPNSCDGRDKYDSFMHPMFSFDLNKLDAGLSNIERSISLEANEQKIKFFISFPLAIGFKDSSITGIDSSAIGFEIELTVQSDTKEDVERGVGVISVITISDLGRQYYYTFDFVKGDMSMEIKTVDVDCYSTGISNEYNRQSQNIFTEPVNNLTRVRRTIDLYNDYGAKTEYKVRFNIENHINRKSKEDGICTYSPLARYVENIAELILDANSNECELGQIYRGTRDCRSKARYLNTFEGYYIDNIASANELVSFDDNIVSQIKESAKSLDLAISLERRIMYLPIHSISRNVLYDANDKNDFVAQSIRNYMLASSNRKKKREMKELVKQWMKMFDLGEDFVAKTIEGEYYSFKVYNKNKKLVNLADLGTGAIQLIVLFLNIATIVDYDNLKNPIFNGDREAYSSLPTILIEEPEQNLHPLYQSRLADLFDMISYGVNVIVETHSEYLIRRIQVLQAYASRATTEKENSHSFVPFKVYYFPNEGQPYDMGLKSDGWFEEKFGEGFFDVADKAYMIMLNTGTDGHAIKRKRK